MSVNINIYIYVYIYVYRHKQMSPYLKDMAAIDGPHPPMSQPQWRRMPCVRVGPQHWAYVFPNVNIILKSLGPDSEFRLRIFRFLETAFQQGKRNLHQGKRHPDGDFPRRFWLLEMELANKRSTFDQGRDTCHRGGGSRGV